MAIIDWDTLTGKLNSLLSFSARTYLLIFSGKLKNHSTTDFKIGLGLVDRLTS
jgi:hypothetical protein